MLTKKLEKSESKLEDFQRDYISNKSFVNESIHNITEAWLQVSQILLNKTESLQSVLDAEKENILVCEGKYNGEGKEGKSIGN